MKARSTCRAYSTGKLVYWKSDPARKETNGTPSGIRKKLVYYGTGAASASTLQRLSTVMQQARLFLYRQSSGMGRAFLQLVGHWAGNAPRGHSLGWLSGLSGGRDHSFTLGFTEESPVRTEMVF